MIELVINEEIEFFVNEIEFEKVLIVEGDFFV